MVDRLMKRRVEDQAKATCHLYQHEALQHGTQGVLASKFPISILMQIQGQHGCQIFRKIVYNYVPISDFATRSLNLRKPKKFQIFCKIIFIFC